MLLYIGFVIILVITNVDKFINGFAVLAYSKLSYILMTTVMHFLCKKHAPLTITISMFIEGLIFYLFG
jgi:hypothetical protein